MLELALCATVLKDLISPECSLFMNSEKAKLAEGINQHRILLSNELKEQYINFFKENGLEVDHIQQFFAQCINVQQKCTIVNTEGCTEFNGESNMYLKALKNTCYRSYDRILISDHSKLNKVDLNRHGIELIRKNETDIDKSFNTYTKYTFPIITWKVSKDEDSKKLGEWLGRIIENEESFVIYDNYIGDSDNIKNFKKYILKYISKGKSITIVTTETDNIKKQDIISEFQNGYYRDWDIEIYLAKNKSENHPRVISMPHYTIELDRGLSTFGKKGKTFSSSITIKSNEVVNAYRNDVGVKIFP